MPFWNTAAQPRPIMDRITTGMSGLLTWRVASMIAFASVTLIALALAKHLLTRIGWYTDWKSIVPFAAAAVGAAVFLGVRYAEFTPLLRASLRASAVGLLVLLIVEAPDYTVGNPALADLAHALDIGYWFALGFAAVSVLRPSFVVPVAIYILTTRLLVGPISGLQISTLDIRYMIDMALYVALFGIFVVRVGPRLHPWLGSVDRQNEIVGAAFGLHLANYFWSGFAKMEIGPTPWYWAVENQTYNQIPYTIESGLLPTGHIPWLTDIAYTFLKFANTPLNIFIVVVQLFAILCVLRVNWLKVTSVLFDFLHIGIYVFGGLFFWPWIWNNLTIWWAARTSKQGLALNTKVACITAILLGAPALKLNEAAWLAWFDVADSRQVYFEAVTADGRQVKVPNAFFLSHSYSVSHAYMGDFPASGQYDYTMLASSDFIERNEIDGQCVPPASLPEQASEAPEKREQRQDWVQRFLAAHHEKMAAREETFGRGSYYFHAHHHPSNPFLYPEFNSLKLQDVVGYNLVLESNCHRMDKGRVAKTTWGRHSEFYSVR